MNERQKKAQRWLKRGELVDERIKACWEELNVQGVHQQKLAALTTEPKVSGGERSDPVADAATKSMEQMRAMIAEDIYGLHKIKENTRKAVMALEDPTERLVLQLRYLCGKQWREIERTMQYSKAQLMRTHRKALENLRF